MSVAKKLLAFDLGAESGRGILGLFDGSRISLEVIHRFPNGGVQLARSLHWNVLRLYEEMLNALTICGAEHGSIDGIGVDTWGVDFALLGRGDTLLGNPRHYRDPHTEGILEEAFQTVPREEIFRQTGLQFMRFNTLFQLLAMQRNLSPLLDVAEQFLLIPDLFNFFFTGEKVNEHSNVSTTQMYDPSSKTWASGLVQAFGLPTRILGTIVQPGTTLGPLRSGIATETGVGATPVIAPATHDTGSAVAAVPAKGASWAYISSGTWSLMGVEIAEPLLTEETLKHNFTNEGGVNGTIRLLKNIMGLWLVQQCRKSWEKQGRSFTYAELVKLAEQAKPFVSLIDPDDELFILPEDMPKAIADFCSRAQQPMPEDPGAIVRCALESLALRYRWVVEKLEELTGQPIEVIHIVGGGSQNKLLSQLTANACNRQVLAGPIEATAIGNLLVQALGLKLVDSLDQAREVVRQSFPLETYEPEHPEQWHEPYQRFLSFLTANG